MALFAIAPEREARAICRDGDREFQLELVISL